MFGDYQVYLMFEKRVDNAQLCVHKFVKIR